jgi:DNA repair protein RadD
VFFCAATKNQRSFQIDEAHLLPPDGEGMYQTFLKEVKIVNPLVRLIGLTATPYRI